MDGRETDDIAWIVDCNQQYVGRCVLDHELVPFIRREHRLASELAEVRPACADGGVEHCTDVLSIPRLGESNRDHEKNTTLSYVRFSSPFESPLAGRRRRLARNSGFAAGVP